MGCCCCVCLCADCSDVPSCNQWAVVLAHGQLVTTNLQPQEGTALRILHAALRDLFVTHTVCVIRTEIRPVVAFPFSTGIGHYHSREFWNEKGQQSRAPGNNNPNCNDNEDVMVVVELIECYCWCYYCCC